MTHEVVAAVLFSTIIGLAVIAAGHVLWMRAFLAW